MEKIEILVKKDDLVSNVLIAQGFSYNSICKLLRNKDIRIDSNKISQDMQCFCGQTLTIFTPILPQKKFEIVFEDENVFVINKKSGIEVEGEDGVEGQIKGSRAVHRLDRNTEGLLVMAKTKEAEEEMSKAIKNHKFVKKYLAEVIGNTNFNGEKFTGFLVKDSKTSSVKIFNSYVKNSVKIETIFKTLKKGVKTSIVEAELITGKTHQIRAHLAFLGHAIVGDGKYGKNEDNRQFKEKNQKLFCYYLKLNGLGGSLEYLNNKIFKKMPDWAEKTSI